MKERPQAVQPKSEPSGVSFHWATLIWKSQVAQSKAFAPEPGDTLQATRAYLEGHGLPQCLLNMIHLERKSETRRKL